MTSEPRKLQPWSAESVARCRDGRGRAGMPRSRRCRRDWSGPPVPPRDRFERRAPQDRHCSALRSIPTRGRVTSSRSRSAAAGRPGTASRRRWRVAASSGSTPRGFPGRVEVLRRALSDRQHRDPRRRPGSSAARSCSSTVSRRRPSLGPVRPAARPGRPASPCAASPSRSSCRRRPLSSHEQHLHLAAVGPASQNGRGQ